MRKLLKANAVLFTAAHVAAAAAILVAFNVLYYNDYPLMIYFQHRAAQFFGEFAALWGYDPFFSAGYPLNFTWNSNLDLQFLQVLLHPLSEYAVLVIATAAAVLSAPVCFLAGLRNFGLDGSRLNWAMIIMLAYWWTGLPVVMLLLGMPSALLVFHLSFYAVSLFYRLLKNGDDRVLAGLYVLAPLCFIAHKTAIVTLGVPAFILLLCNLRSLTIRRAAHLLGIAALVLAVNSFWLVPFLELLRYKVELAEAPHGLTDDPLRFFKDYFTLTKIMGHKILVAENQSFMLVFLNTILRDILLGFGIFGIIKLRRRGSRAAAGFFGVLTAVFLLEIYLGSFWRPAAMLNPTRYIGYLDSFLAIPAATGAFELWNKIRQTRPRAARKIILLAWPATIILLVTAGAHLAMFVRQINTPLDPDSRALAVYLAENTTPNGRIMLEDSGWNDKDNTPPKYGEGHFPSLLPDLTGREFIGGPYPYAFLVHHYADFHDARFLNRPLGDFSEGEMRNALDLYHIRHVVCWSDDCMDYMYGHPSIFRHRDQAGKFHIFDYVAFRYSPFIAGDGFAVADHTGIRAYRVRPGAEGTAALKYHAFDRLGVRGGGPAGVYPVETSPVGFIEVAKPKRNFKIINTYGRKHKPGEQPPAEPDEKENTADQP